MLAVTGTSGFIGRSLVAEIASRGVACTNIARNVAPPPGTDTIIDMAGLAHRSADEASMMQANYHRPVALFRAAQAQGVKRFIFISSVAADAATTPYGKSKRAAELGLLDNPGDTEVAIVRPPLVYGSDAPANFGMLLKLAKSGLPLPFAAIRNRRSLVGRSNLVDAILYLALTPMLPTDIYTVTDGIAVALPEIIKAIRRANGLSPRLFPIDKLPLTLAFKVIGRGSMASQLFEDLVFDDSKIRALGWTAPLPPLAPAELLLSQ